MKKKNKCEFTSIGGQAVIEGIMMRGPEKSVLTVRKPNGEVITENVALPTFKEKFAFLKLPLIRGVVGFVESMTVGYKILMRSAEFSIEEEETLKDKEEDKPSFFFNFLMIFAAILGVGLALVLFMWLPTVMFNFVEKLFDTSLLYYKALIEGIIKLFLFLLYIYVVALSKDIKRVFMYHGAEHKTIFCYEAKLPLTVENVRKQSRFHPRCGTSFMFLMIAVGILFSTVVILIFPELKNHTYIWVTVKILLLPVFCAFGYEILKICGKHNNLFTKIVSAPGLWVQRITTKEPDDGMIEVAIEALRAVIPENNSDIND